MVALLLEAQEAHVADVGKQTTVDYGMGLAPIFFW